MGRLQLSVNSQQRNQNINMRVALSLLITLPLILANLDYGTGRLSRNPPSSPPPGQRCAGRNFNGRRCCTPENPCDEGEGDCDGPGDGGNNDGHRGCKGDLICGSNNCLQFGAYYHPKDDCCERPKGVSLAGGAGSGNVRQQKFGWGPWSNWTPCGRVHQQISGRCRKIRTRKCVGQQCGSSLQHSEDLQEQYCRESDCDAEYSDFENFGSFF